MAKIRIKTEGLIEIPLDEVITFMVWNPDLVIPLKSGMPKPKLLFVT